VAESVLYSMQGAERLADFTINLGLILVKGATDL
jgi:hypothetical protein